MILERETIIPELLLKKISTSATSLLRCINLERLYVFSFNFSNFGKFRSIDETF